MSTTCVISVLGPDQPGLVERLSAILNARGGNWRESRLSHLAGQFAGILEADLPPEALEALHVDLAALEAETGLRALVALDDRSVVSNDPLQQLEVVGQDRPGIVHRITDALSAAGANVEHFRSSCESAPMTGEALFRATIQVRFPADADLASLESRLSAIGDELMLDVALED